MTKELTRRLREAYSSRSSLSLLDFSLSTTTAITKANQSSAHAFLSSLFTGSGGAPGDSQTPEEIIESEVVQMLESNKKPSKRSTPK